ncbi:MAG: hypothetical protein ACE5JU_03785 [Candidatus Binatia bacterium]
MRGRKKAKNPADTMEDKINKIESAFENIKSQLKHAGCYLATLTEHGKELDHWVSSQTVDLQNQNREKMATGHHPDAFITLEEDHAVDLEELEKKMEEKCSLLTVRERELQDLQKRMSEEVENLVAGIREKDLLLAATEMELKSFKQTIGARVEELEILVKNQARGKKMGTRMLSFLVDTGKKN